MSHSQQAKGRKTVLFLRVKIESVIVDLEFDQHLAKDRQKTRSHLKCERVEGGEIIQG